MAIAEYVFPLAMPRGLAPGEMSVGDCQRHPQVDAKAAAAGAALMIRAVSTSMPWCAAACLTLKVIWD